MQFLHDSIAFDLYYVQKFAYIDYMLLFMIYIGFLVFFRFDFFTCTLAAVTCTHSVFGFFLSCHFRVCNCSCLIFHSCFNLLHSVTTYKSTFISTNTIVIDRCYSLSELSNKETTELRIHYVHKFFLVTKKWVSPKFLNFAKLPLQ